MVDVSITFCAGSCAEWNCGREYRYGGRTQPATEGGLHLDAGDPERARARFLKAREQTESPAQQHLLDRKLRRTMN